MRDADALINRILLFDGHPNLQRLGAIQVGETPEEMLQLAFESEKGAVAQFNAGAEECHALGDHGSAAVFEDMVRDEERHADWFETQLDAIVGPSTSPKPDYDRAALAALQREEVQMVHADVACEEQHIEPVETGVRAEYEAEFRKRNADLLNKVPPP